MERKGMNEVDQALERIIETSGDTFDSHDVIRRFAQENQRLYASQLAVATGDKPFQTLHSSLGRRIKAICERHGYSGKEWNSPDFFKQDSNCVLWSRS
jgi:hypothetical protein